MVDQWIQGETFGKMYKTGNRSYLSRRDCSLVTSYIANSTGNSWERGCESGGNRWNCLVLPWTRGSKSRYNDMSFNSWAGFLFVWENFSLLDPAWSLYHFVWPTQFSRQFPTSAKMFGSQNVNILLEKLVWESLQKELHSFHLIQWGLDLSCLRSPYLRKYSKGFIPFFVHTYQFLPCKDGLQIEFILLWKLFSQIFPLFNLANI